MKRTRSILITLPLLAIGLGCWPDDEPRNILDLLVHGDCNANGIADNVDLADGTSQDCNGNDIPDECELADGSATDDNHNGLIDECEPKDCNQNGRPDRDDIASGASSDCDGNGVPDECQPDADGDGVIDPCDDCDDDPSKIRPGFCGCGHPDADLDNNGQPDCFDDPDAGCLELGFEDDHAAGEYFTGLFTAEGRIGSAAFDGNFTFELDLGPRTSQPATQRDFDWLNGGEHHWRFTYDGQLAEFEVDGVVLDHALDVTGIDALNLRLRANQGGGYLYGLVLNGQPLNAELLAGPLHQQSFLKIAQIRCGVQGGFILEGRVALSWNPADPPKNSHLAFQLTAGQVLREFVDCNGNGIADHADLAEGRARDCNQNNIPDACDLASGLSNDLDADGVPDECAADCNANGLPDSWDIAQGAPDCNANGIPDECEADTDGDGLIDACDGCPEDPAKTAPGDCGCGVPDVDSDGNGVSDCLDNADPITLTWFDSDAAAAEDFTSCLQANLQAGDGAFQNLNFTYELNLRAADAGLGVTRDFTWDDDDPHTFTLVWENGEATLTVDGVTLAKQVTCSAPNALNLRAQATRGALTAYDLALNGEPLGPEADLAVAGHGPQVLRLGIAGQLGHRVELTGQLDLGWHWLFRPLNDQLQLRLELGTRGSDDPLEHDCNGNGIEDADDIANGTSADCDADGVPDECQLADGSAADANHNGVLDACETDCDNNGLPDDLDIVNGAADCNANGLLDGCELADGSVPDVNHNGIPDGCEDDCDNNGTPDDVDLANGAADCDGNGILDRCDIAAGAADANSNGVLDSCETDCNHNGVPDDLDIANNDAADCDGNGVPDSCDIAAGAADVNNNGVPDVCETDCDENGLPDDVDLANGAADCNANGALDSCDIAAGLSADANSNGIPDECESDCNANGQPDDLDISTHASTDVNNNAVPDECEPDCNENGVPDEYDVSSGSTPDCNGNGLPDSCDLAAGTSADENGNGIPDECDPDCNNNGVPDDLDLSRGDALDCNANGIPDSCDLAAGTSTDANGNGIPDECDPDCNANNVPDDLDITNGDALDCNANGVPDSCDLAAGTSADANSNGVPDECDPDCNQNGVPDDLDLTAGTAADCNSNGVPDSCDLAAGTSTDANNNGVPDECDPDCNGNGVPDDLDIANGDAADCNANGVPDSCDLAAGTSVDLNGNNQPDECDVDCNGNGVPDDLDIANGDADDCDGNGVPDSCDLAGGAPDANDNGVLDACDPDCNANNQPDDLDLLAGTSNDCNHDGIPDECQADADGDGVPDDCDACPDTPAGRSVDATGCEPLVANAGNGLVMPELKLITLSGTAQGGVPPYTYAWSAPDWDGATTAEVDVFPTATTTYTLTVTDSADPPQVDTATVALAIVPRQNLQYEITDLGSLSAQGVTPDGLNDLGHVVGYYYTDTWQKRAFLYENGTLSDLGHLGGGMAHAYDINNAGDIVGESATAAGDTHAFKWIAGEGMTDLGTLGGPVSVAYALNELGDVVGYAQLDGSYFGFIYRNGVMEGIGLDYYQSGAFDINDNGKVVGTLVDPTTYVSTGFRFQDGNLTDLGSPLLADSQAWVINNDGMIAGYSWEGTAERSFILAGDYVLDLGQLAGLPRTYVYGINNAGQIVGGAASSDGLTARAFVFTGGEMRDLTDLLIAGHGWDRLETAYDVNTDGQIVGTGLKNGVTRGFLLTPVNP